MPTLPFLKLSKLPDSSELHIWADYVELVCLTDPDELMSKSSVLDRLGDRKILGEKIAESDDGQGLDDLTDESERIDHARRNSTRDILKVDTIFRILRYRVGAFGDFYPFALSSDGGELSLIRPITPEHKLYLFFLLSSNSEYITARRHRNRFYSNFEVASFRALQNYLPDEAQVHMFGTHPLNNGKYSGQLRKKIETLANDLHEKPVCDLNQFSVHNPGDKGLDLVAWLPLGDDETSFLIAFGQCACTLDDWVSKQHSSSAAAWRNTIHLTAPPSNFTFIPFCFRDASGKWYASTSIQESIVIDRLRLTHLLRDSLHTLTDIPYDLVERAIEQRDPIA